MAPKAIATVLKFATFIQPGRARRGERFVRGRHEAGTEVKAITYSAMQIRESPGDCEVFVIVDIRPPFETRAVWPPSLLGTRSAEMRPGMAAAAW